MVTMNSEARTESKKAGRGCTCTAGVFFPEESFSSWASYVGAIKDIPARLADRVLTRSTDSIELHEVKAQSHYEMKRSLSWWDLIWFGLGAVVGAGIFVMTGLEARDHAGPAVLLSYVVAGTSALLSVFCYTEFAVEVPVAGGSFAYLRIELGDFLAYIAAGNILVEYVVGGAAVARAWTSYFATLCNRQPDDFRILVKSFPDDFGHLDPISVVVCVCICVLAVVSVKGSSRFNYIASIIHMVVIAFIVVAGFAKADLKNYQPFAPYGAHGVFQASAVLFFGYTGFDSVATMAEETKNPARDIPIGLVGSMVITTILYCLLATALCMMQPYQQIDIDAPFSVAFESAGWGWAKYIVAFGALKGITSVLLAGAIGQARYVTHIARTHMLPPWLAAVDPRTGTPVNATVSLLAATAFISFFSSLGVLANLISIATLLIFLQVSVALLVRRYYATGTTTPAHRNLLVACIIAILLSSIGIAVCWNVPAAGWIGYAVCLPVLFLATLAIAVLVPQAKAPKIWGTPLVPWLPVLSIFMNVFLLGSIDTASYVRFGVWTAGLILYYLLFGLHASYDTAKEIRDRKSVQQSIPPA